MFYEVCPVGVISGKEDFLTYSSSTKLAHGQIVLVPFGRTQKTAVVWKEVKKPSFKTKPIEKIYSEVLPEQIMKLAKWISDYYATRLSLVLRAVVPTGTGKNRRKAGSKTQPEGLSLPSLNAAQKKAVAHISSAPHETHLLHGVTGSGKTRVYLELAKKTLESERSVLVLVPEIALTPQLTKQFHSLNTELVVLHSKLTEAERHLAWQKIRSSTKPLIVLGARSALFSPLADIGLIIIDECHEPSFTQDSQPKYSSLRVAKALANIHANATLILGSATPAITDYYIASTSGTSIVELSQPVHTLQRKVVVVDARERANFTTHPLFSNLLLEKIRAALKSGEQILLFHNRRATARLALCANCGWSAECKNCHVPMRLHHDVHQLKCHICALTLPLPADCPSCKQPDIEFRGFGSKRIEQEVKKLFPDANAARFDSDTLEKEQIQHRYGELVSGEIDIIIGTQGLAKGFDLPRLSTIGVVSTDTELHVPDFSSSERTFQLVSQVIGRAGRKGQEAHVILQTLNPDNFVIEAAKNQDYKVFYSAELANRQAGHLPPYTFLLQLQVGYKQAGTAELNAQKLKNELKSKYPKITVRGPAPAFREVRGGKHYAQLVISAQSRAVLVSIASSLPQPWQFTLDPINLL